MRERGRGRGGEKGRKGREGGRGHSHLIAIHIPISHNCRKRLLQSS